MLGNRFQYMFLDIWTSELKEFIFRIDFPALLLLLVGQSWAWSSLLRWSEAGLPGQLELMGLPVGFRLGSKQPLGFGLGRDDDAGAVTPD